MLSCARILYSAILNNSLRTYLESIRILVEEQNGLRKGRSTVEHICTLRNGQGEGKVTFCYLTNFQIFYQGR